MAIISAGVIMNLVFAFLMAVVAFGVGVPEPPCVVGQIYAGEAAWQANLRPGDKILEIAGKKMEKFRDLQTAITLGSIDVEKGVPFRILRDGKELDITIKPGNSLGVFAIGVGGEYTTKLLPDQRTWLVFKRHAVIPGSAADRAKPAFCNGDQIAQIDRAPIKNYAQINAELARTVDRKIEVAVVRVEKYDTDGTPSTVIRRLTIPIEPDPTLGVGLVMKMGPVTAIQADSPAEAAGIKPGDRIVEPNGDPMTLPDRLRRMAGKTIKMKLEREKGKEPIAVSVRLREPTETVLSLFRDSPVAAPALGAAYRVLNEVDRVIPGSPADKADMKPGDVLVAAKLIAPGKEELQKLEVDPTEDLVSDASVDFSETDHNWPSFLNALQDTLPGTTVELSFLRTIDNKAVKQTVSMTTVASTEQFNPDRGFRFLPEMFVSRANSLGEMLSLGAARTLDDVTVVFRSVRAIGTGQVPLRGLSGPWGIIEMALRAADEGKVKLLLFLTFLSANLAVLNFLPIPVLDGGHFVLLCYEGINGKPASEGVQTVLAYVGLAFLLALMIWVIGLDSHLIPRH